MEACDAPELTARSGKWLVFVSPNYVDNAWEPIRLATEAGRLGPEAKVSTALPSPLAPNPQTRVICVYTYDWTDETDVMRVREELRALGNKRTISYKTDADTRDGRLQDHLRRQHREDKRHDFGTMTIAGP